MSVDKWLLCPICGNQTCDRIREDTVLKSVSLFCPKCKQETIISVEQMNMTVIREPATAASQMEKRGILNREIEVTNQRLRQLKARIRKLQHWLKEEQQPKRTQEIER